MFQFTINNKIWPFWHKRIKNIASNICLGIKLSMNLGRMDKVVVYF